MIWTDKMNRLGATYEALGRIDTSARCTTRILFVYTAPVVRHGRQQRRGADGVSTTPF
jgi:hypothetical protein